MSWPVIAHVIGRSSCSLEGHNLRADDLDARYAELARKGITPVHTFPPEPNGKFAHIPGPDGITIELWQPADPDPYDT